MPKQFIISVFVMGSVLVACQNTKKIGQKESQNSVTVETQKESRKTSIAFTVARNYFVKNNAGKLHNPKIETAEEFNKIFGMATTMGKDGKPTTIDFTKQYVIAVVLPETDLATTVEPVSLRRNEKGEITLMYKTVVGQKQSYTTIPNFAIIVDKAENGTITVKTTN